jgi:hypothetical protein
MLVPPRIVAGRFDPSLGIGKRCLEKRLRPVSGAAL